MRAAVSRIRMLRTPYNGHSTELKPVVPATVSMSVTLTHAYTHVRNVEGESVKLCTSFHHEGFSSAVLQDLEDVASSSDRVTRHAMFRQSQDRVAAIIGTVSRAKKPTSLSFQFLPAYLTVFPSFVSSPRAAAREKSRAFHAFRNVLIGIFCGRIERRKTRSVCLD